MAGVIGTGNFPKALWPGVEAWVGASYNQYPPEWKNCFDLYTSKQAYEEDVLFSGMGLAPQISDGGSVTYGSMKQGYVKRYTMLKYGIGYQVTEDEISDNLYPKLVVARSQDAGESVAKTIETVAANVYNRCTNGSYVGGDGVTLLSTAHPIAGGTFSNKPTNDVDLSEVALEDALIAIAGFVNDAGLIIAAKARTLIIPRQLIFTAERLLNNPFQPDTAERNINAMYQLSSIPDGYKVNHYLTDPDAWFIRTDVNDGMKFFMRQDVLAKNDNEFDTGNAKYKVTVRFAAGWTLPQGLYGSTGG